MKTRRPGLRCSIFALALSIFIFLNMVLPVCSFGWAWRDWNSKDVSFYEVLVKDQDLKLFPRLFEMTHRDPRIPRRTSLFNCGSTRRRHSCIGYVWTLTVRQLHRICFVKVYFDCWCQIRQVNCSMNGITKSRLPLLGWKKVFRVFPLSAVQIYYFGTLHRRWKVSTAVWTFRLGCLMSFRRNMFKMLAFQSLK